MCTSPHSREARGIELRQTRSSPGKRASARWMSTNVSCEPPVATNQVAFNSTTLMSKPLSSGTAKIHLVHLGDVDWSATLRARSTEGSSLAVNDAFTARPIRAGMA